MPIKHVEPIVLLLTGLVVLFSLMLIGVARFMSSDGQTFQVISGLVTGFAGALLMRVKPRGSGDAEATTVESTTLKVERTQPEPPPLPKDEPKKEG